MSCYHPLVGIWDGEFTSSGKRKYKIDGALDPSFVMINHPGSITVPCGKCIGCRLDYSRLWADRMMLELDTACTAIFVTLTYSNQNITWCKFDDDGSPLLGTLVKRDCQLFLKRLRKHFSNNRLRFYLAGEYGSNTLRPHYHAIIYGLSVDDFPDFTVYKQNHQKDLLYISDILTNIWGLGFVVLADVTWQTCAYVARYVTKKLNGQMQLDRYDSTGQLPEFSLMSRKPGIGADYLAKHPDCLDFQSINISTPEGGRKIRIPKYYLRLLSLTDPERFDNIMVERRNGAIDAMFSKMAISKFDYLDQLDIEENKKLDCVKSLKRL